MTKTRTQSDGQQPGAYYALVLLMAVALFAYVDRVIIAVLQEGIRADLGLSDTQLGSLTGLGFAIFYTLFAFPVARLADVWKRKYVIAIALVVWSLMTAGSGLAMTFLVLLGLRIGVAIGEAGGAPTSHSMISDFFSRHKRGTALAVWGVMMSVGPMVGFWVGGRLQDAVGWRDTFLIIGLAGFILVPLVLFTLPEPKRGASDGDDPDQHLKAPPMREVLRTIWNLKSFLLLSLATGFHAMSYLSIVNWSAPFYQRSFGLSASDTGDYMGIIIGVGGISGTLLGGVLADWLGKKDVRLYMVIPAVATLLVIPAAAIQFLSGDLLVSIVAGGVVLALTHIYAGPVNATQQSLVSSRMRAMMAATLVFIVNVIGMGLGPFITGFVSDVLQRAGHGDADSLRYAILVMLVANIVALVLYLWSAARLPADTKKSPSFQAKDLAEPAIAE